MVPVDSGVDYLQALGRASIAGDAEPFAALVRDLLDSPPPPPH